MTENQLACKSDSTFGDGPFAAYAIRSTEPYEVDGIYVLFVKGRYGEMTKVWKLTGCLRPYNDTAAGEIGGMIPVFEKLFRTEDLFNGMIGYPKTHARIPIAK